MSINSSTFSCAIHGFAEGIEQPAKHGFTHGGPDRRACGVDTDAALQSCRAFERDGAHAPRAEMLLDLCDQGRSNIPIDGHGVIDRRQVPVGEIDVDDRAVDGDHTA